MHRRRRVLTALNRKEPDRVPRELSFGAFTPALMDVYYKKTLMDIAPEEYFDFETRVVKFKEPEPGNKFDNYYKNQTVDKIKSWGTGNKNGSQYHFTRKIFPMAEFGSVSDIEKYPFPDYTPAEFWDFLKQETENLKKQDYAVIGELHCTLFEIAWDLRGFDRLLIDFAENNKIAEVLLDKITEIRIFQAGKYAEAGVDIIQLGDDVGMQTGLLLSKEMWRKWLKPRLKIIIDKIKNVNHNVLIFYHSDGNVEPIIPELIELGIDILNPVQPECMDPVKIKKMYGKDLSFWGTVGTQQLMPFATPEKVKEEVKRMISTVGEGGGLLIAPTHILEPEVPWHNIIAFFETVDLYGKY